jgi:hypothetical protein
MLRPAVKVKRQRDAHTATVRQAFHSSAAAIRGNLYVRRPRLL